MSAPFGAFYNRIEFRLAFPRDLKESGPAEEKRTRDRHNLQQEQYLALAETTGEEHPWRNDGRSEEEAKGSYQLSSATWTDCSRWLSEIFLAMRSRRGLSD